MGLLLFLKDVSGTPIFKILVRTLSSSQANGNASTLFLSYVRNKVRRCGGTYGTKIEDGTVRMEQSSKIGRYVWNKVRRWGGTYGTKFEDGTVRMEQTSKMGRYVWNKVRRWDGTYGINFEDGAVCMEQSSKMGRYVWNKVDLVSLACEDGTPLDLVFLF